MSKVMGGGWGKSKRKFMQRRVTEKRNREKKKRGKKFLQSELRRLAYRLYASERQLDSHFILQF